MMNFEETVNNLRASTATSIVLECLTSMTNEEVLFHPGFSQDKKKLTSLYYFRLKNAEKLSRDKFKDDEIESWQKAIDDLENSQAKELELNWVRCDQKSYLMFWDKADQTLQAIFYLYPKEPSESEVIVESTQTKYPGNAKKYIRGKLVE